MNESEKIISRISNLSAREFENLVFDCMRAIGVKNLIWRTPGPDGGRDMEGQVYVRDISGHEESQLWYIECKRYSTSINWNVIWKKIAAADSRGADVLLIATNNNPSPSTENRISNWNRKKRKPSLRVWRGYQFPPFLRSNTTISASYGLVDDPLSDTTLSVQLSTVIASMAQSAYSSHIFGQDKSFALEAAASLSELYVHRLSDLKNYGKFVVGPQALAIPDFDWIDVRGRIDNWEEVSLRAILTGVRYFSQCDHICLTAENGSIILNLDEPRYWGFLEYNSSFLELLVWARCEMVQVEGMDETVKFIQRNET